MSLFSFSEELEYLNPDFEPNSLRVIDLRRILSRHNVPYNSTVKKAALVKLFRSHITLNADKIRMEIKRNGLQPSTPNNQSSSTDPPRSRVKEAIEKFELLSSDGEASPPPKQKTYTRRKIPKPIMNQKIDPISSEGELSPPPIQRTQPHTNQDFKEFPSPAFSKRKSKEQYSLYTDSNVSTEDKMFSDENLFQSGGEIPKKLIKKHKKKTKTPTHTYSKKAPISISPPKISSVDRYQPISDHYLHPLIEDTSILDEAERYLASRQRHRRKRHHHKFRPVEPYVEYQWGSLWVFLCICLMVFLFYVRFQYQKLGYCKVEDVDSDIPQFQMSLLPTKCTPCPIHGKCQNGEFLGCDSDYLPKYTPFISFINPLRVKCVPDSARMAKIEAIIEMSQEILNTRAGIAECYRENADHDSRETMGAGLRENELQRALMAKSALQQLDLPDLWPSVVRELSGQRLHIEVSKDLDGRFVFTSKHPEYPIECRLRQGIIKFLIANIQPLVISIGLMTLGIYCTLQYNAYLADEQLVQQLVQQVYRKLQSLANTSKGVSVAQLRDYLLFDVPPRKRLSLWRKVKRIVEIDTNVRTTHGEVNGEKGIFWEWIG